MKHLITLFLGLLLGLSLWGQAGRVKQLAPGEGSSFVSGIVAPPDTNKLWLDGSEDGIPKLWNPFTQQYDAVKFDYEVDNIGEIPNGKYSVGARIISKGIDSLGFAEFTVHDDSISGWVNDGYLVIETANSKYAIISPSDNIMRPRYAGAKAGTRTTVEEQRMFDFLTKRFYNVTYDPGSYKRSVRDTVKIPYNLAITPFGTFELEGFGAVVTVDSFAIGHYFKANNSPSIPSTSQFRIKQQGFRYNGGSENDASKGTFYAGLCRSDLSNMSYSGLDSAMVNTFGLGNNYHDMWFHANHNVNFWGGSDNVFKTWSGSTEQNAAFNVNRITGMRFTGKLGAQSHIHIYIGGGNAIRDIISEGSEPLTNIIIDENSVPVIYANEIHNVHLEDQSTSGGSKCVWGKNIMGILRLTDVYKATSSGASDTVFHFRNGGTGRAIVDNVSFPYYRELGAITIKSYPKSDYPTIPYAAWFSARIFNHDYRFLTDLVTIRNIHGAAVGGDVFGTIDFSGSLLPTTHIAANRLGNSAHLGQSRLFTGMFTNQEGFIAHRITGGGFGFEIPGEVSRDSSPNRGAAKTRFDYNTTTHNMFWIFKDSGIKMELDSIGSFRLLDYGTGIMEAANLGKTASNKIAIFSTDGTILEDSIINPQSGTNTIQSALDSLNAHITALEAAAPASTVEGNTPTVTSGTTLVITHNLGSFPNAIHVTPAGDIGKWYLSSINTTTMTLNYETVTPSAVTIYWQVE